MQNLGLQILGQSKHLFVAYKGSAAANLAATAGASLTVTYTPTAGNLVVAGIQFSVTPSAVTCKDQNGNALALVTNKTFNYLFQGVAVTGATSYKFSWTTTSKAAGFVGEYTGVKGVGTNASGNGSSTAETLSLTTTKTDSFMVCSVGVAANVTYTLVTGKAIRIQNTSGTGNNSAIALVDNTTISSGTSLTCATSSATGAWSVMGVEIYPRQ